MQIFAPSSSDHVIAQIRCVRATYPMAFNSDDSTNPYAYIIQFRENINQLPIGTRLYLDSLFGERHRKLFGINSLKLVICQEIDCFKRVLQKLAHYNIRASGLFEDFSEITDQVRKVIPHFLLSLVSEFLIETAIDNFTHYEDAVHSLSFVFCDEYTEYSNDLRAFTESHPNSELTQQSINQLRSLVTGGLNLNSVTQELGEGEWLTSASSRYHIMKSCLKKLRAQFSPSLSDPARFFMLFGLQLYQKPGVQLRPNPHISALLSNATVTPLVKENFFTTDHLILGSHIFKLLDSTLSYMKILSEDNPDVVRVTGLLSAFSNIGLAPYLLHLKEIYERYLAPKQPEIQAETPLPTPTQSSTAVVLKKTQSPEHKPHPTLTINIEKVLLDNASEESVSIPKTPPLYTQRRTRNATKAQSPAPATARPSRSTTNKPAHGK